MAHELLADLEAQGAPGAALLARTVYFDLDGGESGLTPELVGHLRRAYFVYADDSTTGTRSANAATMIALGTRYADKGGVLAVNAARSGCRAGAKWCLHDALVTERPHNPDTFDLEKDYQGFLPDRPAAVAYLSAPWNPPPSRHFVQRAGTGDEERLIRRRGYCRAGAPPSSCVTNR